MQWFYHTNLQLVSNQMSSISIYLVLLWMIGLAAVCNAALLSQEKRKSDLGWSKCKIDKTVNNQVISYVVEVIYIQP